MTAQRIREALPLVLSILLLATSPARAAEIDWEKIGEEATGFLQEYIRIDTTNPPGNEIRAARFLADRFEKEGIQVAVFESEKGRGSVMARLAGTGEKRPIILLNHLDVVPANPEQWTHPPFAAEIHDGYLYGRGATDCKGTAVIEAMAMLALQRSGRKLERDVIFLGTAGEETGGKVGAGWLVENHFEALGNPEFVLNEGGSVHMHDGRPAYHVSTAEKTPLWLRLTATGTPGHGSTPHAESAVTRLIRALERIRLYETDIRVTEEAAAYYRARAELFTGEKRERYRNVEKALEDPEFREELLSQPRDAALLRNTISITVLEGSNKTNVVPPSAHAELDCRLLPGEDPDAFVDELRRQIDDPEIEVERIIHLPPSSSPSDTPLFRAIRQVAETEDAIVVPTMLRGFTDAHYFRDHGVVTYGFIPAVIEPGRMHSVDERIPLEALREGPRRLVAILEALAAGRSHHEVTKSTKSSPPLPGPR